MKTVDAIYKDMIMTSAPLPRNVEDGYCYSAQLEFVQVRRAKQQTEQIPTGSVSSEAAGMAGATETDAGQASQEEIGTGVSIIDNNAVITVDTSSIPKGQTGDITTGLEQKSHYAAMSLWECMAASTVLSILTKIR